MEQNVEIRVLEASDIEARLEAQYRGAPAPGAKLTGAISGPRLEGSRTLPATVSFTPLDKKEFPAAAVVLPDPCFWSPQRPFLYDLELELRHGTQVIDSAQFSIALQAKHVVKL